MEREKRRTALLLLLFLPTAFLVGCGASASDSRPGAAPGGPTHAAEHTAPSSSSPARGEGAAPPADPNEVRIDNFAFAPRSLTVAAGTKVTWVNRDDVPHTATSSAKPRAFDSRTLDTDDRFSHTFTTPGVYDYFCAVHPNMTGQIIVK
jgi:plastocyanin